jgi:hypothetical protein
MGCGEGAIAGRMPILGQRDMVEAFGEAIDDRHHGITVGNSKRAAGAEIVLHVDNQQQIVVAGPDLQFGPTPWLISPNLNAKTKLEQQGIGAENAFLIEAAHSAWSVYGRTIGTRKQRIASAVHLTTNEYSN